VANSEKLFLRGIGRTGTWDRRLERLSEGQTLNNLGNAYQELRRFEEAIDCYQQTLAIFRETGDRHGEGIALGNLGVTYHELRQPGQASECLLEAAAAMRDASDHEQAARLEQLALDTQSRARRRWQRLRRGSST